MNVELSVGLWRREISTFFYMKKKVYWKKRLKKKKLQIIEAEISRRVMRKFLSYMMSYLSSIFLSNKPTLPLDYTRLPITLWNFFIPSQNFHFISLSLSRVSYSSLFPPLIDRFPKPSTNNRRRTSSFPSTMI